MVLALPTRYLRRLMACALLTVLHLPAAFAQTASGIPALPSSIDPSLLPPDLQRQLRERMAQPQAAPSLQPQETIEQPLPDGGFRTPPVSLLEEEYSRRAYRSLRQVGYDVFGIGQQIAARQVGAVQDSYVLGPGDELLIYLRGRVNQSYTVPVTREGTIVLPDLPPLPAAGLNFGEFRRNLRSEVEQRLLATDVHVSLARIREISVTVNGEVYSPGVITLNGLATVVDALHLAGGVKKSGTLRNVHVIRDGTVIPIDLYDLILGRSTAAELGIATGDRIFVPVIGATLAAAGRVKRPGIFELLPGHDSVAADELLQLAGGVWLRGGYRFSILRIQADGTERLIDIARPQGNTVRSGEILFAEPAVQLVQGDVELAGHVKLPGTYPLSSASSVRALVSADKLRPDPYLPFAVVADTDPQTRATQFEKVDLGAVLRGQANRGLSTGDRVFVLGLEHIRFLTSAGVIDALDGELGERGTAGRWRSPDERGATTEPGCAGLEFLARWVRANPRSDLASGQFAAAVQDLAGGRQTCPPLFDQVPGLLTFLLQNAVVVRGNVLNPGVYPIVSPDGMDQVLSLARRLSGSPRIDAFGDARRLVTLPGARPSAATRPPPAARRASASEVVEVDQARVELLGNVRYPGTKALSSAPTLRDLIGDTSIYGENPYLLFGIILRRNPQTLLREVVPFSPAKVISGETNMPLTDRDSVRIFGFSEIRDILDEAGAAERVAQTELREQESRRAERATAATERQARALAAAVERGEVSPATAAAARARMAAASAASEAEAAGTETSGGAEAAAEAAAPGAGRAVARRPDSTELVLPRDALRRLLSANGIDVLGEVLVPGTYPVAGRISLDQLVSATGGITGRADISAVEITRYPLNRGSNELEVDRSLVDLRRVPQHEIALVAGNTVRVNPLTSSREPGFVEVAGEVQRPGRYDIIRGEKLSSLIERAGGMQPTAYPAGAVFTREGVRRAEEAARQRAAREFHRALIGRISEVSEAKQQLTPDQVEVLTDLLGKLETTQAVGRLVVEMNPFVLAQRPELDVTLESGDRIIVPRRPLSVFVSGEVFNPGAQQFALNRSVSDYIRAAGGATDAAEMSNAFVIRPDGSARRIGGSAWSAGTETVAPGSWIVVPRDLTPLRWRDLATSVTQIFSQLAVSAASIAVISRNN